MVYVSQPPDLLAYIDVDRNLKFDPAIDKREVILTGFNAINHDHALHSLTAGTDGKFYFNNGNCGAVFTDKSGKTFFMGGTYGDRGPNWPANHLRATGRTSDDGHVWTSGFAVRMDPDGSNVEIVSHGLRNSYEQTLTSFGDMFQNDNDDPRGCRTTFALEYGCAGYFTRDGRQRNKMVKRPGQSYDRVHWRQDDPGTMDAGEVYGGGAPTGITFYENGALDPKWNGLLLSGEAALNTILGYQPTPKAGTFALERFNFVTTNPEKEFEGADFSGPPKNGTDISPKHFHRSTFALAISPLVPTVRSISVIGLIRVSVPPVTWMNPSPAPSTASLRQISNLAFPLLTSTQPRVRSRRCVAQRFTRDTLAFVLSKRRVRLPTQTSASF